MQVCASCTSGTITGLTNGVSYQFIAFATNSVGNGAYTWSNVVVPGTAPDLLAPSSVMATGGDRQATIAWTRPGLRLEGLTTYVVKVFAEGDLTTVLASTTVIDPAAAAVVPGLTNGTRYVATVTASTALLINVTSSASAPLVPAGPPFAPTGASAARGDRKATVTWLTPGDNGSPITGYEIATVKVATGEEAGVTPASQSPAEVSQLVNGTEYAFKVRAVNAVNRGPYSAVSNAVVAAGTPLAPPNVRATGGNGLATVSWDAADGNGAEVWGYTLSAPDVGPYHLGADTRSWAIFGLTNGTKYTFSVRARNVEGDGASASVSVTPTAPSPPPVSAPNAPTILQVAAGSGQASLTWAPPTEFNGSTLGGYRLTAISNDGSTRTMDVNDPGATTSVFGGLVNGVRYVFTVAATSSNGVSPDSPMSNPVWLAENPNGGFPVDITLASYGFANCMRYPDGETVFYFCRQVDNGQFVIPGASAISVNYTRLGQIQGGGNYAVTAPGNAYEGCSYLSNTGEWVCSQVLTDTPWQQLLSSDTGRHVLRALSKTRISAQTAIEVSECAFHVWEYIKMGGDSNELLMSCASAFEPPPS